MASLESATLLIKRPTERKRKAEIKKGKKCLKKRRRSDWEKTHLRTVYKQRNES